MLCKVLHESITHIFYECELSQWTLNKAIKVARSGIDTSRIKDFDSFVEGVENLTKYGANVVSSFYNLMVVVEGAELPRQTPMGGPKRETLGELHKDVGGGFQIGLLQENSLEPDRGSINVALGCSSSRSI